MLALERSVEGLHVSVLLLHVLLDELVLQAQRLHGIPELAAAVLRAVVCPKPRVWDVGTVHCW